MYPTLLRLPWIGGSWNLPTYSAALTTGLFVFCLVGWFGVRRQGGGVGSAAWYVLAVTVSMLVGARIAYGALRPDGFSKPWNELLILDFGHFYLLGGFLAAAAVGWPLSRAIRLDPWRMLDALAPAAAAAMAVSSFWPEEASFPEESFTGSPRSRLILLPGARRPAGCRERRCGRASAQG
ncbi:MAG TPA: hypothetical protein PK777_16120 [Thermoguttaceae bacterium]|nr:hypothetical protein [Thermoguttaceae bacterium]